MRDLLFLAHRIPYPPNKGDKIRSWHILRHLAGRYRVHLAAFVDDPDDWRHEAEVAKVAASCCLVGLDPTRARLRSLHGLLAGEALSLPYYRDAKLAAFVRRIVAEHRPEVVFAFSSTMAQYLPPAAPGVRRIVDLVDVDSEKWRAYGERMSAPRSWLYAREARTLLAFERRVVAESDASLFVSAEEAALFRRLAPEVAAKVDHLGNGVDTDYFAPAPGIADPYGAGGPTIVFTGAMGYWPNVEAVCWFAEAILPLVRAHVPAARFAIVGADPAREVKALAALAGVTVTGRVPDVRPYLAHAAVAVAPMRIARGVQNKVLEAMAMARPVVVTPAALEGLAAAPGRTVLAAADAAGFAQAVVRVLGGETPDMGARARELVLADYGWAATLARLDGHVVAAPALARAG